MNKRKKITILIIFTLFLGGLATFMFPFLIVILDIYNEINDSMTEDQYYTLIPQTTGRKIIDGDPEPLRPNFKESIMTIEGIDADNDGVRDDAEVFINSSYPTRETRILYKRLCQNFNQALKKYRNKDKIKNWNREKLAYTTDLINILKCITHYRSLKVNSNKDLTSYPNFSEILLNTAKRENIAIELDTPLSQIKKSKISRSEMCKHYTKK